MRLYWLFATYQYNMKVRFKTKLKNRIYSIPTLPITIHQIAEERLSKFIKDYPFQPHYGPGVGSASNRNEYQESSWGGKGRPMRKADNRTVILDPIV
jgi:hypothetical protein